MPRHPPYTLSSLTTFIDHRRGLPPSRNSAWGWLRQGMPARYERSITGRFAKKVLDDSPPDRKTKMGGSRGGAHCPSVRGSVTFEPQFIHLSKSNSRLVKHRPKPMAHASQASHPPLLSSRQAPSNTGELVATILRRLTRSGSANCSPKTASRACLSGCVTGSSA
jgi:hypothetical protein